MTQVSKVEKNYPEKIVLELKKDKVEKLSWCYTCQADHIRDVIDALLAMGYHERGDSTGNPGVDTEDKTPVIIRRITPR